MRRGAALVKYLILQSRYPSPPHRFIRRCHPYARKSASKSSLRRTQLTLHSTRSAPHGASGLVQAISAWSAKTRRALSRHCTEARVYDHTTAAMNGLSALPPSPLPTSAPFRLSLTKQAKGNYFRLASSNRNDRKSSSYGDQSKGWRLSPPTSSTTASHSATDGAFRNVGATNHPRFVSGGFPGGFSCPRHAWRTLIFTTDEAFTLPATPALTAPPSRATTSIPPLPL